MTLNKYPKWQHSSDSVQVSKASTNIITATSIQTFESIYSDNCLQVHVPTVKMHMCQQCANYSHCVSKINVQWHGKIIFCDSVTVCTINIDSANFNIQYKQITVTWYCKFYRPFCFHQGCKLFKHIFFKLCYQYLQITHLIELNMDITAHGKIKWC